ncbi:MAG: aldo/keto reductase [Candidatus Krumholzibacteriota bacterium]|nr:aldo/keto reductase [Candidatus Krumholzibacteriota bacterium]
MKRSILKNRRDFLKTSFAGVAGMTLLSCSSSGSEKDEAAKDDLVYRKLGGTGIELPVVSIGTGDTSDPGLIRAALDAGVKLLATSQYYGEGRNESMVADVVKERGRDSALIMTSAMPEGFNHKEGIFDENARVEPFINRFEESTARLGGYVDIFLLPFMAKRESVFYAPYLNVMENIKKQGKARFIGIATHSHEDEAIRAAVEARIYDVALVAYNFRKNNRKETSEAIAYASGKGMGIIAMKTMAGAYWDEGRKEPINSDAALKWVLQNEHVHTAVPGVMTFEELQKDIALMKDLSLNDAEKSDLRLSLNEKPDGPFCQQCGKCIPQCRKSLDIPTLMRSHMYAYGYRNLSHAHETISWALAETDPCRGCPSCSVTCAMGFDIRGKIAKIARLNNVPKEFLA